MDWLTRYSEILHTRRCLGGFTTLGVGGPARYYFEPRHAGELANLVRDLTAHDVPTYFLGNGSNLLVADQGVDGAVVSLTRLKAIGRRPDERGPEVVAGAGVLLPHLLAATIRFGLAGLERCVGIPGTVGGAVHQNAGGAQGSFGDLLVSAQVVTPDGTLEDRPVEALGLGYRRSELRGAVVAAARIRLEPDGPREIGRRARAIMNRRKATQPLQDRTPGCIFMNPRGGRSAGRLLDEAGMKGKWRGRASISEKHANFVVHLPVTCGI